MKSALQKYKIPLIGIAIALGVIIAIAITAVLSNPLGLIATVARNQIIATQQAQNISPSRFEVLFCGTGTPQHHPERGQPCLGIIAGGKFFLIDSGQGTAGRLNQFLAPLSKLDTIFLTHLHSDHMSGLGETLHNGWLYGRQDLVQVVGPPGTKHMLAGFQQAYEDDIAERQRVVGAEYLDTQSGMGAARDVKIDNGEAVPVYDQEGVLIEAFRVDHPDWPYAYGYRISFGGKLVVVSGDTAYSDAVLRHSKGADVLIHEAVNMAMMDMAAKILAETGSPINPDRMQRIAAVHTPTHDVARLAQKAKVKQLVVTHLIPPVPPTSFAEGVFADGMGALFDGELTIARDNMRITLIE